MRTFNHLLSLPLSFFETSSAGVLTMLTDDVRGRELAIGYAYGIGTPDLTALQALGLTLCTGTLEQAAPAWARAGAIFQASLA